MMIIPFISLGIVCVLMSVIYTIFYKQTGWKGLLVRGLTMFSLLIFSLVLASLKSLTNAMPMFLTIAFALLIVAETLTLVSTEEKVNTIFGGLINSFVYLFLTLSTVTLAEFNIFALLGGLLLGAGVGLVVWAIKKYNKAWKVILTIIQFAVLGTIMVFGINAILTSVHGFSSVLMTIGGGLLLVANMMKEFAKDKKILMIICNELLILSYVVMACSIYFY